MRLCRSGACGSLAAAAVSCAPPTPLLPPHLSAETGGARRGVTVVSGMPGSRFPGLNLHLSDAATGITCERRQVIIQISPLAHNTSGFNRTRRCFIASAVNEIHKSRAGSSCGDLRFLSTSHPSFLAPLWHCHVQRFRMMTK